jgi:nitroreductase
MNLSDAITTRRSIRSFTDRAPTRAELETIISAATHAPNHRMTQPWRFYILGPEARAAYGLALGNRKAKKAADEAAADVVRKRTSDDHRDLPCMIAVAMTVNENAEIREEDYAATMMAVSLFMLSAVEHGLGSHIRTGAIMDDPAARAAAGVPDGERIVAVLNVGTPAEMPPHRERKPVSEITFYRD